VNAHRRVSNGKRAIYLADLVGNRWPSIIEHVGRGTDAAIVARASAYAGPASRAELERSGARKRVVTKDIGAHQSEPSTSRGEHPVGSGFWCFVYRNLLHRQPSV